MPKGFPYLSAPSIVAIFLILASMAMIHFIPNNNQLVAGDASTHPVFVIPGIDNEALTDAEKEEKYANDPRLKDIIQKRIQDAANLENSGMVEMVIDESAEEIGEFSTEEKQKNDKIESICKMTDDESLSYDEFIKKLEEEGFKEEDVIRN